MFFAKNEFTIWDYSSGGPWNHYKSSLRALHPRFKQRMRSLRIHFSIQYSKAALILHYGLIREVRAMDTLERCRVTWYASDGLLAIEDWSGCRGLPGEICRGEAPEEWLDRCFYLRNHTWPKPPMRRRLQRAWLAMRQRSLRENSDKVEESSMLHVPPGCRREAELPKWVLSLARVVGLRGCPG